MNKKIMILVASIIFPFTTAHCMFIKQTCSLRKQLLYTISSHGTSTNIHHPVSRQDKIMQHLKACTTTKIKAYEEEDALQSRLRSQTVQRQQELQKISFVVTLQQQKTPSL